MRCPCCGSDAVDQATVDIGIGEIPCGPRGCEACHWVEGEPEHECLVQDGRVVSAPEQGGKP